MAQAPVQNITARVAGAAAGDWSNPSNVIGQPDDNCANMGAVDKENLASNFGFDIPLDATITGVVAHIKAGENGDQNIGVQLAEDATVIPPGLLGNQRSMLVQGVGGNCSATVETDVGTSLASWGLASLDPATVNATDFGLAFIKLETSSIKVDAICLEIQYQTDEGPAVQEACFAEPPPVTNTITVVKSVVGPTPGADWSFNGSGDIGGGFTLPAAGGFQSFAELADGSYTITESTKPGYLTTSECFISDVSVATGDDEIVVTVEEGETATCTFTNTYETANFTVNKVYNDATETAVSIALVCEDGDVDTTPLQAAPGNPAVFEVTGFAGDPRCTATESGVPQGYIANNSDCQDVLLVADGECTISNVLVPVEERATFRVTKDFTDDNPSEVDVQISCNTGLPLEQSKLIAEGDSVEFVVVEYDPGEMDCDVFEIVPEGYSETYTAGFETEGNATISDDGTGCHFGEIVSGDFTCHIVNTPDPVDVVIEKEWVFEGSSDPDGVDTHYELTLFCDGEIVDGYNPGDTQEAPGGFEIPICGLIAIPFQEGGQIVPPDEWCKTFYGEGPDTFTAEVIPEYPSSHCYVVESIYDSAVEVDNGCQYLVVSAGNGASCTITNTVFFEGIPALNQYGLALLALLMLGIGFVGFRRLA